MEIYLLNYCWQHLMKEIKTNAGNRAQRNTCRVKEQLIKIN